MAEPVQVAVLVAAYHARGTIARAVASALAQPEVSEVLVIDDASTDDTLQQAATADDGSGRLKLLQQPINRGPSAARNRGIAESRAPWLTVLDADDFYEPGRIAGLLAHANSQDFVADDLWKVSDDAIDGPRTPLLGNVTAPTSIDFTGFVRGNVSKRGHQRGELGFMKPLIRRGFLDAHGLRFSEAMRLGEDYELYARALALGARMVLIPPQGYIAVVREDSLSARHSIHDLAVLRDSDAALARDFKLTTEQRRALALHYRSVDSRLQWRLLIEAVKRRDVASSLGCFTHSPAVSFYLLAQLWQQFRIRVVRGKP